MISTKLPDHPNEGTRSRRRPLVPGEDHSGIGEEGINGGVLIHLGDADAVAVPTPVEPIAFGKARIRRSGSDIALISVGVGVHRCLDAATSLAEDGIEAIVLDLRSIAPLDQDAIVDVARAVKGSSPSTRTIFAEGSLARSPRS